MKRNLKCILVIFIISLVFAGVSTGIYLKKIENIDTEKWLQYNSAIESSLEGTDIGETYTWFAQGYEEGDNIVGEEVARILKKSSINIFIKTIVVTFILSIIAMIISKLENKKILPYLTAIVLSTLFMIVLPRYEVDIKYKKDFKKIEEYKDELYKLELEKERQLELEKERQLENYISKPQIRKKIKSEFKPMIVKRKDANYIYISLTVEQSNFCDRKFDDVISIKSITASNGDELEFKLGGVYGSVASEWKVIIGIKDISRNNDDICINIENKTYDEGLDGNIVVSLSDATIYEEVNEDSDIYCPYLEDFRYFDYYLDEKNQSFDENIIKNIKIERFSDFEVKSVSVKFRNGKSLDTNEGDFQNSKGEYYVDVYLEVNFSGDYDENIITDTFHSYSSKVDKLLNEYGYDLFDIEIKDLNGNIIYNNLSRNMM
ncbi:MAG: hypothetical protein SPE00_02015 [Bacilli bacterium]|nr:hypothetical protein [Bacilli bacterium]